MRRRLVHLAILAAFGISAGHFAYRIYGPAWGAEYFAGGDVEMLRAPEPRGRNLYLRRTLHLPKRPTSAWIQVLGADRIELYVNGALIDRCEHEINRVGVLADLTPLLQRGRNVLAVVSRQSSLDHLPGVAVEGSYTLGDGEHPIGVDGEWRCGDRFERGAAYWFSTEFDDRHWLPAERSRRSIWAPIATPRWVFSEPNTGKWIGPGSLSTAQFTVRRDFDVSGGVSHAWLRMQCTGAYRLAINGSVVDVQEEQLGTTVESPAVQWIYDLSPFVRSGANSISVMALPVRGPPRLMAELEVTGTSGRTTKILSDDTWQCRASDGIDWLADEAIAAGWSTCVIESDQLMVEPWSVTRRLAGTRMPAGLRFDRTFALVVTMVVMGLLGGIAARVVAPWVTGSADRQSGCSPAALALVPVALYFVLAAKLAGDARVAAQSVYHPLTLVFGVVLLAVQWVGLVWLRRRYSGRGSVVGQEPAEPSGRRAVRVLLLLVVIGGGYLRTRDMVARPLSPDEVSMYRTTVGFLQRGFPSIEIHEDMPVVYAATSELVYVPSALALLVSDDERVVVRAPAVLWSILTILLIYWCGRRMFHPWVGVVAAALYSASPVCIGMANLGRYYSQLQACTLLTVYFFYRTIEPSGSLNRRALWLTVVCFLAMFLSWEGSALIAVPMMAAAVIQRRARLGTILRDPAVWQGMLVIAAVVGLQSAHRNFVQIGRPLFGSGASDVSLTAMWRYPRFDLLYYVTGATWTRETFLPLLGLCGSIALAVRHRFRHPARVLLIVFVGVSIVQAAVLPVTARRYSYHLTPMLVLLSGAAVFAVGQMLTRVRIASRAMWLPEYARGVAALGVTVYVALACGLTLDLADGSTYRVTGDNLTTLKQPGQQPAVQYVLDHIQPDDVVLANGPHIIDHYLGRPSDFWLQTELRLQATMDDVRPIPIHRLKGTVLLRDMDHLKEVFARYRRVWCFVDPGFNARTNVDAVNAWIRANMDVAYEDHASLVLFSGDRHRTVRAQDRSEAALTASGTTYLP